MNTNLLNGKPNTQLNRVICAASNELVTLKEIQRFNKRWFGIYDQETSISARLREAARRGYLKERKSVVNPKTGRVHFLYRLSKEVRQ